jgi:probable HAF family extracellular repeat protein
MKSKNLACVVTAAIITLATTTRLSAQEDHNGGEDQNSKKGETYRKEHHRYKLVDLGTLGGPKSYLNGGGGPRYPSSSILSRSGEVAAAGDTGIPDLIDPGCPPCLVVHAFDWDHGVQTNLGALPAHAATGPNVLCLDCAWVSWIYSISDTGTIVGQSENGQIDPLTGAPAFLAVSWRAGKVINLGTGTLGGNESTAGAVNRQGDIVGAALNRTVDPFPGRCPYCDFFVFGNGTEPHAVLWRDGKMRDLGTLGGPDSAAFFVNDDGQVAGASDVDYGFYKTIENPGGGPSVHPFLVKEGKMLDLVENAPTGMFGGSYGIATWLNNRGQVTGTMNLAGDTTWHSFLWDHGTLTDLGTLGGANTTSAWLSETGHAVGKSDVAEICGACAPGDQKQLHHPFVWKDGAIQDLGLLPGDTAGSAYSINRYDQIVGRSLPCAQINPDDSCDGPHYHAFLWENGSLADLQSLVVPGAAINVDEADEINDQGEIAGTGTLSNGDRHVVLLIPCDPDHDIRDR